MEPLPTAPGGKESSGFLTKDGYTVTIVQNPLISLDGDVAATKRAIANLSGQVILVGHSYGGSVITEAGGDPKVVGLVYVAAFAPDKITLVRVLLSWFNIMCRPIRSRFAC